MKAPISISPRMVEDIKRIPTLALRLEWGDIAVREPITVELKPRLFIAAPSEPVKWSAEQDPEKW